MATRTEFFGRRHGVTPALDPQLHSALVYYGYDGEQATQLIEQAMEKGRYNYAQKLFGSKYHYLRYYIINDSFMLVTDGRDHRPQPDHKCDATAVYITGNDDDSLRTCADHLSAVVDWQLEAGTDTVPVGRLNAEAGFTCELADIYQGAQPAPGQSNDNYVYRLTCGHDWDSPYPRATGSTVRCEAHHRYTEVINGDE